MNIDTREIKPLKELSERDLDSGSWFKIEEQKQKHEATYNLEKGTNVNLHKKPFI